MVRVHDAPALRTRSRAGGLASFSSRAKRFFDPTHVALGRVAIFFVMEGSGLKGFFILVLIIGHRVCSAHRRREPKIYTCTRASTVLVQYCTTSYLSTALQAEQLVLLKYKYFTGQNVFFFYVFFPHNYGLS